jgi:hypothetical protein
MDNKMLKAFALLAKDRAYQSGVGSAPDWADRALRIAGAHEVFSNDTEVATCAAALKAVLEPFVQAIYPPAPSTPKHYTTVLSTARAALHGSVASVPISPKVMEDGVPRCSSAVCPEFDGKRCQILGHSPEAICVPSVREMAKALNK